MRERGLLLVRQLHQAHGRGQGLWRAAQGRLRVVPGDGRRQTQGVRGAHPLHPPLRLRGLVPDRGADAAAARLPRAVRARDVPRDAQAHVGAPHLVGAATRAAGARLDRALHPREAAALAWPRAPHGPRAAAAAHALRVGGAQAPGGRAPVHLRPHDREGDGRLRPRSCALARARRGPRRVARDAPQRRGAGGLQAGAAAAGADADVALPRAAAARRRHAHQRRDRRVEARRERQLLTTSRCAACLSL